MKKQSEWIFYKELEFNDSENNVFSIDTRDFHCGYRLEEKPHTDLKILKNYPYFFHTEQEVKDLLDRYYKESGGKSEWRFFNLIGIDNWNMKYIRIWRSELGFIVCNSKNRALNKDILSRPVEQKHLNRQ